MVGGMGGLFDRHIAIRLKDQAVLRLEHNGALLFNRATGDLIELDREASWMVANIKAAEVVATDALFRRDLFCQGRKMNRQSLEVLLGRLIRSGMLEVLPDGILKAETDLMFQTLCRQQMEWPEKDQISAPETVHWALTYRCTADCHDCYMQRHKHLFTYELNTRQAVAVIDKITATGVFQLAIGGGEPLSRADLPLLVSHAASCGLAVHVTTGCHDMAPALLKRLASHIKVMQIGVQADDMLANAAYADRLKRLAAQLDQGGVRYGANLVMNRSGIRNLERSVHTLASIGFLNQTLLRYKPPARIERWIAEKPGVADFEALELKLHDLTDCAPDLQIRIDCALSFLLRRWPEQSAFAQGIKGCTAADRIMALAPDGSVYPCSQLVGTGLMAGNLSQDEFSVIWNHPVLRRYRTFRSGPDFIAGTCGSCPAKNFCGGCRVFAPDALGSDPGCPEPGGLFPDRPQLTGQMPEAADACSYPAWLRNGCNPERTIP